MNAKSRKELSEIVERLQKCYEDISVMRDEEQEKFDNLPEGLQLSERGEAMEEAANSLDSASNDIESAIEQLEELV